MLLEHADRIIILDSDGCAIASGSPDDLRVLAEDGAPGTAQALALLRKGEGR